jgi:hypothetical protein
MMPQHGVAHQGEDDRRRVGQAGGLDDEAVEGRNLAPLPLAVELADGRAEIVAQQTQPLGSTTVVSSTCRSSR